MDDRDDQEQSDKPVVKETEESSSGNPEELSSQKKPSKRQALRWNSPDHNPEDFRLSLVEHLEELRTRIIRSFLILLGFWAISWTFAKDIYVFLTKRATDSIAPNLPKGSHFKEVLLHAPDAFMNIFKLSFFCAIIAAFPFIVLQVWAFIAPGLKPEEQKPLRKIGPVSLILFLTGGFFCWLILPAAFAWFASYMEYFPGVDLNQEAGTMSIFTLKSILAFGIGFQLPLVVFVLGALNLLSSKTLLKYWRHGAVAIFFISGAITPSNDIPTMLMMAIPLTVLFMISAYAVRFVQKDKGKDKTDE
ncbi:MAG: twin-arginine translocase subunit TatC [Armatimonadetes bacterium]|nr:twin-arginine translocase subunit TatC [Armatimonadota bacterium]MBS1702321.1 twin-arginine translocase subunit TatC [Armatimonadota bacterium]MBS1727152.1 twin-arginine translocase subunit TatC [Armatimonadota bacterium]